MESIFRTGLLLPARTMKNALQEQQQHFDAIAGKYLQCLGGETVHEYYQKMGCDYAITALRNLFVDPRQLSGVELGCGLGDTTVYFHHLTRRMYGVDFSNGMIEQAKERHQKQANLFIKAWFHDLPFAENSLDFAVSFGTFHHLLTKEHYEETLREIWRVLRPGGAVIISDTNPWNPLTTIISRSQTIDLGNEHFFSRSEVKPIYAKVGFVNTSIVDYGYIPHFIPALSFLDGAFSRLKVFVFGRYQMIVAKKPNNDGY